MNIPINPRIAAAGICLLGLAWVVFTVLFEIHLGIPGGGVQWTKRLVGWAVEVWFLRTLLRVFARSRSLPVR